MTRSKIDALGLEPGGRKSEPSESYDTFEPTTVPELRHLRAHYCAKKEHDHFSEQKKSYHTLEPTPGCDRRKPRLTSLPLTRLGNVFADPSAAASCERQTIATDRLDMQALPTARKARAVLTENLIPVEKSAAASRDCGTIPNSSTERPWSKEEWMSGLLKSRAILTKQEWDEIWIDFYKE